MFSRFHSRSQARILSTDSRPPGGGGVQPLILMIRALSRILGLFCIHNSGFLSALEVSRNRKENECVGRVYHGSESDDRNRDVTRTNVLGLLHPVAYPQDCCYGRRNSQDDQGPFQNENHRTYDIVQGPGCDGNIPVSIKIDLDTECDKEEQRHSAATS